MPDDARTRGIAALDAAYSCAPIDDPNAVQVGGGHVVVTYEQAVDALLAAGWAPPPAPASDDVKARGAAVLGHETGLGTVAAGRVVEALGDAGLLAAPSHLDRLAAWAATRPGGRIHVYRYVSESVAVEAYDGRELHDEIDTDPQEAARRVLARLDAKS